MRKWLHRLVEVGAVVSLLGMVVAVAVQVVTRFSPGLAAPSWTEELSRLCFVYTVAFGVGIGIVENAFPRMELLSNWLSEELNGLLKKSVWTLVAAVSALLGCYSVKFAFNGFNESSPTLGISMSVAFSSMILLFGLMTVYSVGQLFDDTCRSSTEP